MKKTFLFIIIILSFNFKLYSQFTINNNPPYNDIVYLVDEVLLSSNLQTSNHFFEGDSLQISFFNGVNSNIGLDGGIVMGNGNVSSLVLGSVSGSFTGSNVGDVDLNTVANSVPVLIGQNFTVTGVYNVAALEFDFIATSDTLSFRYVFGSTEYNLFENTRFNDVFGFFISGPGLAGPYSSPPTFVNGSVNIATFISEEDNSLNVELPITISSINSFYNSQFYVDNQSFETVDNIEGFTKVMTAEAIVQCGETYHIRLAIGDGSDLIMSSFILLEENSFATNGVNILNNVGISQDSSTIRVKCGTKVTLSAELTSSASDDYEILWSNNDTTESIYVGEGIYSFQAKIDGCIQYSNSIRIEEIPIQIDLGDDFSICTRDSVVLNVKTNDGTPPYVYNWSTSETTEEILASDGTYNLEVKDVNGCVGTDDITIYPLARPIATLSGGGNICEGQNQNFPIINIEFHGDPPFYYKLYDGTNNIIVDSTYSFTSNLEVKQKGNYSIISLRDSNCYGDQTSDTHVTYSSSSSLLVGGELICEGDSTLITVLNKVDSPPYSLYLNNGNFNQVFEKLTDLEVKIFVNDSAIYTIDKIVDRFGCVSIRNNGLANVRFKEPIFPQFVTVIDTILCPIDPQLLLEAVPEGGVFSGKGVDFNNIFNPVNSILGKNWVYYSFPSNCNEVDSLAIEVGCESQLFVPNSFTPNSDLDNDRFVVIGMNIISFEMSIFSRWGELLFKTDDINKSWNGKDNNKIVPDGTYTYVISAFGKDANYIYKRGYINVLR